ncbi:uncharacterized protein LOC127879401 [Dreissena polymorpha]|uniref:uncharacterized protein LOC127879401 n=1 Tax=Dreissena polymorpha TaxID=45954 RepID=UPI002265483D|nr:uncharacterized protein LOC127879401 [Dreissena polymorpha]
MTERILVCVAYEINNQNRSAIDRSQNSSQASKFTGMEETKQAAERYIKCMMKALALQSSQHTAKVKVGTSFFFWTLTTTGMKRLLLFRTTCIFLTIGMSRWWRQKFSLGIIHTREALNVCSEEDIASCHHIYSIDNGVATQYCSSSKAEADHLCLQSEIPQVRLSMPLAPEDML